MRLGNREIGGNNPPFVIAEIGINHNGELSIAKKLIDVAVGAGCDCVKFQKRNVQSLYSAEELGMPRETPFGKTVRDYRCGMEFDLSQYREIDAYCKARGIMWAVSIWDRLSLMMMMDCFRDMPFIKIPSACAADAELLRTVANTGKTVVLATGGLNDSEVDTAMDILSENKVVLMQCTMAYPADDSSINLRVIPAWKEVYGYCNDVEIGYSGHERGIAPSFAAGVLGASVIERHITLDRTMWGSDQAASLEPDGLHRLVRDLKLIPKLMGNVEKEVLCCEDSAIKKLRKVSTLRNQDYYIISEGNRYCYGE